jgi:hypothetical protein
MGFNEPMRALLQSKVEAVADAGTERSPSQRVYSNSTVEGGTCVNKPFARDN